MAHAHPFETLRFFDLAPDQSVIEVWPGGGWYTEILAPYLRDHGRLYAAHFPSQSTSDYERQGAGPLRRQAQQGARRSSTAWCSVS